MSYLIMSTQVVTTTAMDCVLPVVVIVAMVVMVWIVHRKF